VDFVFRFHLLRLGISIDLFTPIFAVSRMGGLDGARARHNTATPSHPPRAEYRGNPDGQT